MGYLKTKTHISWMITAICIGFLLGVLLARTVNVSSGEQMILLLSGVVLMVVALLSRMRMLIPIAILGGCLLGYIRASKLAVNLAAYDDYVGREVIVSGRIDGDPTLSDDQISFGVEDVIITIDDQSKSLPGKIWLRLKSDGQQLDRYDNVVIKGTVDAGFGAYAATLQRAQLIEIVGTGADPMGQLRNNFTARLAQVLDSDEAGLAMGLLAGQKSILDDVTQEAFVGASLTHILVASGYNLTVLVRFARRLFAKRSRLVALILSFTLMILFMGVTGSSASMQRAVLVSGLSLLLWYVGRRAHPVVLLSVVATITILINPTQLWGDAGWYLSFGSFAGVIILAPMITDLLLLLTTNCSSSDDKPGDEVDQKDLTLIARLARRVGAFPSSLVQILIETTSAQLMTLPMIALFMGSVSLTGFVTNIIVLPLLPMAMAMSFMAGLAAILLPINWARAVAIPADWLLHIIIMTANWGATLPGAEIEFQPTLLTVVIYYLVALVIMMALKIITNHNFYLDNVIE